MLVSGVGQSFTNNPGSVVVLSSKVYLVMAQLISSVENGKFVKINS